MSNPYGHDSATVAMLDQAQAMFSKEALVYAEIGRRLIEKVGELQAGADLTALVRSHGHPEVVLAAILATACVELAKAGIRPPWLVSDAG